jgi:hypothetical protein
MGVSCKNKRYFQIIYRIQSQEQNNFLGEQLKLSSGLQYG